MKKRIIAMFVVLACMFTSLCPAYADGDTRSIFDTWNTLNEYSNAVYGLSMPVAWLGMPNDNGVRIGWAGDGVHDFIFSKGGIDSFVIEASEYYGGGIDYDFWCKYAKEMGAGFVVTTLNCANGFGMAPNPVADEYLGVEAGKMNTNVNYIEKLSDSCKKYGLKLGLYAVGDWAQRYKNLPYGDSSNPIPDATLKRLCDVYGYWSELFGDRVSYWWMDGSYTYIGFHENQLKQLKTAIKKGNEKAIVAFSEGPGDFDSHYGQNDFTTGEGYGLEVAPTGSSMFGTRFHRYLPLWDYDGDGSAYAIPEFVEYVKNVKSKNGFMHIGGGGSKANGKGYDSTHTAMYSALKKYVIDGETMPAYIDGSQKVQAGDASKLVRIAKGSAHAGSYTDNVSKTFAPRLMDTIPFGSRGLKWSLPDSSVNTFYINECFTGKNGNREIWAGYENVRIPEGCNNIALSVKDFDTTDKNKWSWLLSENHMEIRIGGLNGEAIADDIKNVGYIDFFKFTKGEYTEAPVDGYRIINIPIETIGGEQDVYLVNVLKEKNNKEVNIYNKLAIQDYMSVVNGEIAYLQSGVGNFDGGDELKIESIDFGDGEVVSLTMWTASGSESANNKIEIYINDSSQSNGYKQVATYYPGNKGWGVVEEKTVELSEITGTHDVYLKAVGKSGVADIKSIRFNKNEGGYEIPNTYFEAKASNSVDSLHHTHRLFDKDGENITYWQASNSSTQTRRMWIAVDLGDEYTLNAIKLEDNESSDISTPAAYHLYVSSDGSDYESMKGVTANGSNEHLSSRVNPDLGAWELVGEYTSDDYRAEFDNIDARYVLIYVTANASSFLGIDEFHAYSPVKVRREDYSVGALDKSEWNIRAWKTLYDGAAAVKMIDGVLSNVYDDSAPANTVAYAIVDMGGEKAINRIVMQRPYPSAWFTPDSFDVYVSQSADAYKDERSEAWECVAADVPMKGAILDAKFEGRSARCFMLKPNRLGINCIDLTKDWFSYGELFAYESNDVLYDTCFMNEDNKVIDSLKDASSYVKFSCKSDFGDQKTKIFMACYKGDKFYRVKSSTLAEDNLVRLSVADIIGEIDTVKVFLWDGEQTPVINTLELTK